MNRFGHEGGRAIDARIISSFSYGKRKKKGGGRKRGAYGRDGARDAI